MKDVSMNAQYKTHKNDNESRLYSEFMNVDQAASYLNISKSYLDKSRVRGDGPPFSKIGQRVIYRKQALDDFARAAERASTSQEAA